jgi:hypothetical protein
MTGECSPEWIKGPRLKFGKYTNLLAPWTPELLVQYNIFVQALATMYASDSYLCGVWISGPTTSSQEMHTNGLEKVAGYSPQKMREAWLKSVKIVSDSFTECANILSVSGQNPVQSYIKDVIEETKKLGKQRAVFQHNSLGTQTSLSAVHHKHLLSLHSQGYRVGAEMVQPGHYQGIKKFPQASFVVLYPGDQNQTLPARPRI